MAAQAPEQFPAAEALRILPEKSAWWFDEILRQLEAAYAAKNVEEFVSFFTEDFEQVDVNRRVHVSGIDAWREQTVRVNAAHREMGRTHHGRVLFDDRAIVEVEWFGIVRGDALGQPSGDPAYRYGGVALLEFEGARIRRQIIFSDIVTLERQLGTLMRGQGR